MVIAAIGLLYAAWNLTPYFGIAYESCQTMYSGLRTNPASNNHLFMPQWEWTNLGETIFDLRTFVRPPPAQGRMAVLASFLTKPRANLDSVRLAVAGLCAAGYSVRLVHRNSRGPLGACEDPYLSVARRWLPVPLFDAEGR